MAVVFQNDKYYIVTDSKTIIGVMGDYEDFFNSLDGNIYYLSKRISASNRKVYSILDIDNSFINDLLKEFNLNEDFLNKRINELSHSEQKLLKYLLMVLENKNIIIIDEPFIDLDSNNKRKIILLLNKLVKDNKTIIIGSNNSNIIYQVCKKVLFINKSDCDYGDTSIFKDKKKLKKYHISMPDIVKFVDIVSDKNVKLKYSKDIRDLIKDVYRNVSQK